MDEKKLVHRHAKVIFIDFCILEIIPTSSVCCAGLHSFCIPCPSRLISARGPSPKSLTALWCFFNSSIRLERSVDWSGNIWLSSTSIPIFITQLLARSSLSRNFLLDPNSSASSLSLCLRVSQAVEWSLTTSASEFSASMISPSSSSGCRVVSRRSNVSKIVCFPSTSFKAALSRWWWSSIRPISKPRFASPSPILASISSFTCMMRNAC